MKQTDYIIVGAGIAGLSAAYLLSELGDVTVVSKNKIKELKIAVCVSGQLRGYKKAFNTWKCFTETNHDVDFYCSVWDNVGSKGITRDENQLRRIFPKEFMRVFLDYTYSLNNVEQKFENLFNYFNMKKKVTEKQLADLYNPVKYSIIKEEDYVGKDNMYKMHMMIQKAYELIEEPQKYDLIVRMRADKPINSFAVDGYDIYNALDKDMIFVDNFLALCHSLGFKMGDQFAVGKHAVMGIYSKTFSSVIEKRGIFKKYPIFTPHATLFLSMLSNDVEVRSIVPYMKLGALVNDSDLHGKELVELLKKDLSDDPEVLAMFLNTIENS